MDKLGYEVPCDIHDLDYEDGKNLTDKVKADLVFSKNIMGIGKIHSPFIAITAFVVLTLWPGAYIRFYDKD